MKSNTITIIKKEFARFFGDRQLLFTAIIMPGLLLYIIYSFIGSGIQEMITEGANEVVTLRVENMPASMAPMIKTIDSSMVIVDQPFDDEEIKMLEDKGLNLVMLRFPADFDQRVGQRQDTVSEALPNVEIYYNSTNNASSRVYMMLNTMLSNYGRPFTINVPQEGQHFDQATNESVGAMIWSKILPMLLLMMLFSGVMAIAPSAIAGEKERGTIATLLVTPMRRNELALGKIVSISGIALLSGISSFIGIALSLPKMIQPEGVSEGGDIFVFHYAMSDYLVLLLVILSTVLIMASAVSLLSALAKDVKNAGTMVVPFMVVIMMTGLLPMFQNGASESLVYYLIPFYNSIQVMTSVFAREMEWMPVIVTLAANVSYTGIAVWVLTRMFNSERIMFSK
jgi:sodium transport system permease protein